MNKNLKKRDQEVVWHPFSPVKGGFPILPLVKAEGVYLITEDGEKIIDGISSWWVNNLGHSNPEIAEELFKQAKNLSHVIFAGFTHEPAISIAEKILEHLPGQSKVFFSDNGSTSVEVALKIVMQFWKNQGQKNKKRIIALEGAYHGDTFGAMAVGERGGFNITFEPYLFDVDFLPFPTEENEEKCLAKFEDLLEKKDVAGFIFEPLIQGAAGMRIYSPKILEKLIHKAHEYNVICIADEVFTGFYRTDKLFASDYIEEKPDIFCLSKGLTAGTLPLSLTTVSTQIFESFNNSESEKALYHGHSFTGNPLGCAVALKSFEILNRVETQESHRNLCLRQTLFVEEIKNHPAITKANCLGTVLSIELKTGESSGYYNSIRESIYHFFIEKGILLRPLGNILYFLPAYIITNEQLDYVYSCIKEFLNNEKLLKLK
ncbi:MAG: adenosylmethionine--8-amino-7-oxononanoate transaminase [Cyclobacteriaceae bacterium]|nr:adenosylmethionine--8-amino-7-oxononanoate transaminase [Cyclobacteriaceae bacterium]